MAATKALEARCLDGKSSAGTAVGYTCQRLMGVPISSFA